MSAFLRYRLISILAIALFSFAPASGGWWTFFFPVEDAPQRGEEAAIGAKVAARELVDWVSALAQIVPNDPVSVYEEIWNSLPDYMSGSQNLPQAMERFVFETLELDRTNVVVERYLNPGDVSEGISGAPIFFVRSRQGGLVVVVKAFKAAPGDMEEFSQELRALSLLKSLNLRESQLVSILSVGRLCILDESYVLMSMSAAPGVSVTRCFKNVGLAEVGSRARADQLAMLRKSVAAVGRALAEVHVTGAKEEGEAADFIWQNHDLWFQRFLSCYQDVPALAHIPGARLIQIYTSLQALARCHHHRVAYVHGDAHTGNYLYDPKTGMITIIDVGRFCRSVDEWGQPCGQPESDFIFMSNFINVLISYYKLTPDEGDEIQRLFETSYKKFPGVESFCSACLHYHRFLFWTRSVALHRRKDAEYTPEIREQVRTYTEIAVDEIRRDVEEWLNTTHPDREEALAF